jgi:predicted dehydrogenase
VLVGYGNYAKTIIIPGVRDFLSVECIHEIDPTQIPASGGLVTSWDTAPCPREGQHFDVWLIAGYHHTHAPLAIRALRSGAYAVVEKPIVTDEEQLSDLSAALKESPRLFSGYHKRYSPMNEWARRDLGVEAGQPISYHCIVYEVPLPRQHWYRWPNSKSRLVSNGCHWIDHFLYLNAFAAAGESSVTIAPDGTINCSVALQNGAFFTMVLTDKGSSRIGVQEFVELRANDVTVQMMNGSRYVAQGRDSIIRRRRLHKYSGFVGMYHTIGRAIRERQEGDSVLSVQVSARLILELEQKLELQSSEREREGAVPPIESYSG